MQGKNKYLAYKQLLCDNLKQEKSMEFVIQHSASCIANFQELPVQDCCIATTNICLKFFAL